MSEKKVLQDGAEGVVYKIFDDVAKVVGYEGEGEIARIAENYLGAPVVEICDRAFMECKGLKIVEIPNTVTKIGESAFEHCEGLTGLVIPCGVQTIGRRAFISCVSLAEIIVAEGNEYFKSIDGNLYSKDGKMLVRYATGKTEAEFTVPDGVERIGHAAFAGGLRLKRVVLPEGLALVSGNAFCGCSALAEVILPETVTVVGNYAFKNCFRLKSVTMNGVTSIGNYAFEDCYKLVNVSLHSVVTIGESAFEDCVDLRRVVIPESVQKIAKRAFFACKKLSEIELLADAVSVGYDAFVKTAYYEDESNWEDGVLYLGKCCVSAKTSLCGEYVVKAETVSIADQAFYRCSGLTGIVFSGSVAVLGEYACSECSSLRSVKLPVSLENIARSTFYGCAELERVVIPDAVVSIGKYAFCDCCKLKDIVLGKSVKSIDSDAFQGCPALADIYYKSTRADWCNIKVGKYNSDFFAAKRWYYLENEEELSVGGAYWRFQDGKPLPW